MIFWSPFVNSSVLRPLLTVNGLFSVKGAENLPSPISLKNEQVHSVQFWTERGRPATEFWTFLSTTPLEAGRNKSLLPRALSRQLTHALTQPQRAAWGILFVGEVCVRGRRGRPVAWRCGPIGELYRRFAYTEPAQRMSCVSI